MARQSTSTNATIMRERRLERLERVSDVVDGGVARARGIRTVSTCHGFIESDWRGRVSQWLQRRALKRFDAVVAVSRAMEEKLREAGVDPAKIHVVLNAVAAKSAIPRDDARRQLDLTGGFVVGWVGRLSHEKGPDLALEAFARLERTDARLVILGDGRDAPALHARWYGWRGGGAWSWP